MCVFTQLLYHTHTCTHKHTKHKMHAHIYTHAHTMHTKHAHTQTQHTHTHTYTHTHIHTQHTHTTHTRTHTHTIIEHIVVFMASERDVVLKALHAAHDDQDDSEDARLHKVNLAVWLMHIEFFVQASMSQYKVPISFAGCKWHFPHSISRKGSRLANKC